MNPYRRWLCDHGRALAALRPEDVEIAPGCREFHHLRPDSDWKHAEMANILVLQSHLFSMADSPWHGSDVLLDRMMSFFQRLEQNGYDDRWYHDGLGMGDDNVDRFTLLPLLEAFLAVSHHLPAALRESVEARLRGALETQLREYGKPGQTLKLYPNMDAYYCAIMLLGWRLAGNPAYEGEFNRFLDQLAAAQFAGGAWTYIAGVNECPSYHDLNVIILGRIAQLSGSEKALSQLRRSLPYYPTTATPSGVMEFHTDCWWKHQWVPMISFAPDILSSLTGDGGNRRFGDLARAHTLGVFAEEVFPENPAIGNAQGLFLYYASLLWQEVPAETFTVEGVFYDENIKGPRGHMDGWSWAATAGHACDTVVGATAHTASGEDIIALGAVTAEVPYRPDKAWTPAQIDNRWDLGGIPKGVQGDTRIYPRKAVFSVEYPLATYRSFWRGPECPLQWKVAQHWEMGEGRMKGSIRLISLVGQMTPAPIIRVRMGRRQTLKADGDMTFRYGPFTLKAVPGDFPECEQRETSLMFVRNAGDATELIFRSRRTSEEQISCSAGQEFRFDLTVDFERR